MYTYWNLSSPHPNSVSAVFQQNNQRDACRLFYQSAFCAICCYLWTLRGEKKRKESVISCSKTDILYQCNRVFSHSELWVLGRMSKGKKVKEGEVEGETKKGQMVASSSQPSGSGHAPIESERTSAATFPGVQENHRLAGNRPSPNNQSVSFFFPMLFFTYHLPQPRATSPSTSFSFPSSSQA